MKDAIVRYGVLLFLIGMVGACQKYYIPNTEIPDTDYNRQVVEFVEKYRRAVENRNIGALLEMASPRYFDNAGTPSGEDDVDRAGLEQMILERFKAISEIRFEMKYRDLFVQDNVVYVQYTFTMSFQYQVQGQPRWHNHTGDKRLEIEMVDGKFLILSGM